MHSQSIIQNLGESKHLKGQLGPRDTNLEMGREKMTTPQNVTARTVYWPDDPVQVRFPEGGKGPSFLKPYTTKSASVFEASIKILVSRSVLCLMLTLLTPLSLLTLLSQWHRWHMCLYITIWLERQHMMDFRNFLELDIRVGWDGMDHTNAMWTTLWYHLVTSQ